jgi:hypothetical protein
MKAEAPMPDLTTAICLYRVAPGNETQFTDLLRRHWPTLHALGLVTDERPQHFRGAERDGGPLFVEIFTWKTTQSPRLAHEHPDVMAIWEPMDKLTEPRAGRPNMEFPDVYPIRVL